MSNRFFEYLEREHARLDRLIIEESSRPFRDEMEIIRLKKQKLLVKDQLTQWRADALMAEAV